MFQFPLALFLSCLVLTSGEIPSGKAATRLGDNLIDVLQNDGLTDEMVAELPQNVDWRNVDGVNYVSPVRDQRQFQCGSCSVFGTLAVVESLVRIKTHNDEQPILSPMNVLECQGQVSCTKGGAWQYTATFGISSGYVSESPYVLPPSVFSSEQCANVTQHCGKVMNIGAMYTVVKINETTYISPFPTPTRVPKLNVSTITVAKALLYHHGPIIGSLKIYADLLLHNYDTVYHRSKLIVNEFIAMHCVTIVGYGSEVDNVTGDVVQFWLVKNSYGTMYGDGGYVRIAIGQEELEMENQFGIIRL